MKKKYLQSKVYKIKLNIYKRKQRYKLRVKNKDKKRWIKSNKNLEKHRKKKGKITLKISFEMDIKKTIRKRSRIELLKDWIGEMRMEKQIVIKNEDITNKNKGLPNLIDL